MKLLAISSNVSHHIFPCYQEEMIIDCIYVYVYKHTIIYVLLFKKQVE